MSPPLVLVSILVPVVLVIAVLWVVFAAIRRAIDRAAAALAPEGVELDSGPVTVTTRMKNFRTDSIYSGGGLRRTPGRLVLTKQRLYILGRPQRYGIIDRAGLSQFTVGLLDGKLHLKSTNPPGASGTIDYRVAIPDANAWVTALAAAGAQRAA